MPSYLRQWFVHQHGGGEPVKLNRCSPESDLLRMSTIRMPENILPPRQQDDEVAICTGNFEATWRDVLEGCTALLALLTNKKSRP